MQNTSSGTAEPNISRGMKLLVLWLGVIAVFSCLLLCSATLYITKIAQAPVMLSAGNYHVYIIEHDPARVASAGGVEIGFSWGQCGLVLGPEPVPIFELGNLDFYDFSCPE
jgi:hypothetical protein